MTEDKNRSPHDWDCPQYAKFWQDKSDREHGSRRYRFELLCDLIPHSSDAEINVLDMGAGFGALSEVVLERFAFARMTCLDGSRAMLNLLRKRQVRFGNRVRIVNANYKGAEWADKLNPNDKFDVIVTSHAMHGVRERRTELFAEIYEMLNPGGVFLKIDIVGAASSRLQVRQREIQIKRRMDWTEKATGERPTLEDSITDIDGKTADNKHSLHKKGWNPDNWTADLGRLKDVGFVDVDVFWKELKVVMIGGYKD